MSKSEENTQEFDGASDNLSVVSDNQADLVDNKTKRFIRSKHSPAQICEDIKQKKRES